MIVEGVRGDFFIVADVVEVVFGCACWREIARFVIDNESQEGEEVGIEQVDIAVATSRVLSRC